ncbi:MAG: hypothetical protein K6E35_07885 [Bacteroidales bacterium]|nr:hypothetical protein [Bacteroidales bacterium]
MTQDSFYQHSFSKGEKVLYKGQSAKVVDINRRSARRLHLVVSFGKNFAAAGYEDIELAEEERV